MTETGLTLMESDMPNSLTAEETNEEIIEIEDEHSPLTEEEINTFYEKVPFNPSFEIPLPENVEVNPYFPNLLRIKPTPMDDFRNCPIEKYKPKRKIVVSSGKPQTGKSAAGNQTDNRSEGKGKKTEEAKDSEMILDETSIEEDSTGISEEMKFSDIGKRNPIRTFKNPVIPNVEDIWKYYSKSDSLMAIVGPHKLFGSSFASLKSGNEIVDEVIDAYMKCLVDAYENTASIDCCVGGSVIRRPNTCSLQTKLSLEMFEKILLPFNSGGHWELLIVYPAKKEVLYIDPLGETLKRVRAIEQSWKTYINRRFSKGLELSGPTKWRVTTVSHSKQFDSVNCGVFIMKFAELVLQGKPLHFNSRKMDKFREEIAGTLIGSCGNVTNNCRACGNSYRLDDEWIQCSSCLWWHHFGCTSVRKSFKEAGRDSFLFLCQTCQGNDIPCEDVHFDHRSTTYNAKCNTSSTASDLSEEMGKRSRSYIQHDQCKQNNISGPNTTESYVVCKLKNIVKICAGCRNKFKKPVRAPYDIVFRHREIESFFDKQIGNMRRVFNNKYYHISANCIQARNPFFVKSSICLPPDVQLSDEHLTYFNTHGIDLAPFLNRKI